MEACILEGGWFVVDFIDRLKDSINSIPDLPIKLQKGYLSDDSLVIYPLPGSSVITEYYDNVKDQQLNYEIAMKSKDGNLIEKTLWTISDYVEQLEEVKSKDELFDFDSISIANKPFISNADEQGWFVFLFDVQAKLTTY